LKIPWPFSFKENGSTKKEKGRRDVENNNRGAGRGFDRRILRRLQLYRLKPGQSRWQPGQSDTKSPIKWGATKAH
jgi:hypothetical protein